MEIVDMYEESGGIEQIQGVLKQEYKKAERLLRDKPINQRFKTYLISTLWNMTNDRAFARELIKIEVEVATENMTDEQVEKYQRQLTNPILQITNELMIASKITNEIAETKKAQKLIMGAKDKMTDAQYENYIEELKDETNLIATANKYKAAKTHIYEEEVKRAVMNMIFGKRIIIEIREKNVKYEKQRI